LEDSQTQIELLLADTRPGVVAERKAQLAQAEAAQTLLLNGPRTEDIAAARAKYAADLATLNELKAGTRIEDTKAAQNQALAANESAKSAAILSGESTVAAPFNCIVEHVLVADGDLISSGTPLIRVSDPSNIWLTVYVPEASLAKISVGQNAVITVDGIDGDIKTTVKSIATSGEFTPANLQSPEERGQQVFAVRLRLAHPDSRIKAGMSATVKQIGDWSP
jgi:HlyD family secretion protein